MLPESPMESLHFGMLVPHIPYLICGAKDLKFASKGMIYVYSEIFCDFIHSWLLKQQMLHDLIFPYAENTFSLVPKIIGNEE